MSLILLQNLWLGLLSSQPMSKWCFYNLFLQDSTILQCNCQGVRNSPLSWIMVISGELWILNTANSLSQALYKLTGSSLAAINVISGLETVENEHGCNHVLNAVITIGKVIHRLELLVNDANASFMRAIDNLVNVCSRLAHSLELLIETLCSLNSCLRVE